MRTPSANDGRRPDHVPVVDDHVDHALQVGVVPGDHPDQEVSRARDRVRLENLGYSGQVCDDGVVAAGLADLEGAECRHRVAHGPWAHLRRKGHEHSSLLKTVEAGLNGAAGHPEESRGGQDSYLRVLHEGADDAGVEVIQLHGQIV